MKLKLSRSFVLIFVLFFLIMFLDGCTESRSNFSLGFPLAYYELTSNGFDSYGPFNWINLIINIILFVVLIYFKSKFNLNKWSIKGLVILVLLYTFDSLMNILMLISFAYADNPIAGAFFSLYVSWKIFFMQFARIGGLLLFGGLFDGFLMNGGAQSFLGWALGIIIIPALIIKIWNNKAKKSPLNKSKKK